MLVSLPIQWKELSFFHTHKSTRRAGSWKSCLADASMQSTRHLSVTPPVHFVLTSYHIQMKFKGVYDPPFLPNSLLPPSLSSTQTCYQQLTADHLHCMTQWRVGRFASRYDKGAAFRGHAIVLLCYREITHEEKEEKEHRQNVK